MKLGKSANLEGIAWTVAPSGMAERLDGGLGMAWLRAGVGWMQRPVPPTG